jgi:FMN phosphatase YigB (HAD superfamily)
VVLHAGLIPGAAELLHELKRRGYRLGLVADGLAESFRNVFGRQYGLSDLFEAQAISEEVGESKPHPAMYQAALASLGIPPEQYGQVIMVGNHLERDIRGANALGLISVWLDWAPRRPKVAADPLEQPQYTIHQPLELLDLLERLEN